MNFIISHNQILNGNKAMKILFSTIAISLLAGLVCILFATVGVGWIVNSKTFQLLSVSMCVFVLFFIRYGNKL